MQMHIDWNHWLPPLLSGSFSGIVSLTMFLSNATSYHAQDAHNGEQIHLALIQQQVDVLNNNWKAHFDSDEVATAKQTELIFAQIAAIRQEVNREITGIKERLARHEDESQRRSHPLRQFERNNSFTAS